MKAWSPEFVRLATAAVETRDVLRSLASQLDAAGDDPAKHAKMLEVARVVAVTHSNILRQVLKDSEARRRVIVARDAPMWATAKEKR